MPTKPTVAQDRALRGKAASGAKAGASLATPVPRKLSARSLEAREQRAARNREQLLLSAAKVIGAHGYRDASVQRITADASLAQGTFYLYFSSRQALFDEVLPHFGQQMLNHVRKQTAGIQGFFDSEEAGLRAVFGYLHDNPWFWRVLREAEVEAPTANALHVEEVLRRYVKFLARARDHGELADYSDDELPTVARFLIAARDYVYRAAMARDGATSDLQESVVGTYRKFITFGMANMR